MPVTASVSFRADMTNLRKELGKVPGVTDKEAKRMVNKLQSQLKRAEKESRKAWKAAKRQGPDKYRQSVKGVGNDLIGNLGGGGRVAGALRGLPPHFQAIGAGVAAVGAAGVLAAKELIKVSTEINKMAKQAAVIESTAEEYQVLSGTLRQFAADELDASRVAMDLRDRLDDAKNGGMETARAFKDLGINLEEFDRLAPVDQLAAMADGLQTVDSDSRRAAIKVDLLGRAGRKMGDAFEGGGDRIRAVAAEVENAGVVSGETAEKAEDLTDALNLMKQAGKTAKAEALAPLIPVMEEAANFTQDLAKHFAVFTEVLYEGTDAYFAVETATDEAAESTQILTADVSALATEYRTLYSVLEGKQLQEAIQSTGTAREAYDLLLGSLKATGNASAMAADEATANAEAQKQAIQALVDEVLGRADAETEVAGKIFETERRLLQQLADLNKDYVDETLAAAEAGAKATGKVISKAAEDTTFETGVAYETRREQMKAAWGNETEEYGHNQTEQLRLKMDRLAKEAELDDQALERIKANIDAELQAKADAARAAWQMTEQFSGATMALTTAVTDAVVAGEEEGTEAKKKAESEAFVIKKLAALAAVTISTAQSIAASAEVGFPAAIPGIIAAAALGTINTAIIAAEQPPAFHGGGFPEEPLIRARQGEAVITPAFVDQLGGPEAVNRGNRGESVGGSGGIYVVNRIGNRTADAVVAMPLKHSGSKLSKAIRESQPRPATHRPPRMGV